MAVLRVNATAGGRLVSATGPEGDWRLALERLAAALPECAPVTILIHGYRYSWRTPGLNGRGDPHRTLYLAEPVPVSRARRPALANWPHALGFSEDDPADGLCVAFGWDAWAGLAGPRCFAEVHRRALGASRALTVLVRALCEALPGRRIACLTHSLGARIVIQALTRSPRLGIDLAVMLGAAERTGEAREMLARQDAARARTEFVHVASRANDLYDALYGWFAPWSGAGDQPLGTAGLGIRHPRWLDVQLDGRALCRWLGAQGLDAGGRGRAVSHWSFYADPGAMALYGRILRGQPGWSPAEMLARGLPCGLEPRWSRLLPALPRRTAPDEFGETLGPDARVA